MSTVALPFTIPKLVRRKVRSLRWLVRGYVFAEGLATLGIFLCLVFWITLFLDWYFEPTSMARVIIGIAVLGGFIVITWKSLLSRLIARLTDSSLALLVERTYPNINQSLVTTIQGSRDIQSLSRTQCELLENTSIEAIRHLDKVELSKVFRYRPLISKVTLATFLACTIAGFALLSEESFAFYLERVRLSNTPWPRNVQLSVVGFEVVNGVLVKKVARDDNFTLEVRASLENDHIVPQQVELRYRLPDGRRGRDSMTGIGEAVIGKDEYQEFHYEFKNLASDIVFDVIGGDDRIRDLHLHVVERPQLVGSEIECVYPDYLRRAPQAIPFSGRVEIPQGTQVVCEIEVNKPLQKVNVHNALTKEQLPTTLSSDNPQQFSVALDTVNSDQVLLVDVKDTDGVSNREPYRLMISVVPDEVPEVSVGLRGIGSAITPQATIPLVGSIYDDHEITSAWIEGQTNDLKSERRPLPDSTYDRRENSELGHFDLNEPAAGTQQHTLTLKPGEQLTLSVKAQDAYDLEPEPHVGSSQRFVLDIVTDSELRSLLEKRELGLRQRFEAIQEKMIATRELLSRIELSPQSGNDPPLSDEDITLRRDRDRLRISGVLQNITQLTFEILGVAEGFENIVVELQNNRIATQELTGRLENNIAEPLHEIAQKMMPQLELQVQKLPAVLGDDTENTSFQAAAIIQSDEIIEAMQRILDRMLELESYNELVELLRSVVKEQKELNEATRLRRLEKLRSLLDEE